MVRTFKYHVADYKSIEIETIKDRVKLLWATNCCSSYLIFRASGAERELTSGMDCIESRDHLF
jgi:hypothetical protein